MSSQPGLLIYFDDVDALDRFLSRAEIGDVIVAAGMYARTGEYPELSDRPRFAFDMIRPKIDRNVESYADTCKKRRYARFCQSEKAAGRKPIDFEMWKATVDGSDTCRHMPHMPTCATNYSQTETIAETETVAETETIIGTETETVTKKKKEQEREKEEKRDSGEREGKTTPRYIPGVGYETEGRPSSQEEIEAMTAQRKRALRKMLGSDEG